MASSISSQIGQLRTNYANQSKNYANKQSQAKNNYNSSAAKTGNAKWQKGTIDDLAKKYGFNYSQSYANQQAKVEADAQRNAYKSSQRTNETNYDNTMQLVDDNLREGITGTEKEYFQKGLANNQSMNDRGLNAGLLADSGLRLAMNQQDTMGNYYRDAGRARTEEQGRYNNESLRLQEALMLVNRAEKAKAASLFQELRQQGYQNLSTERGYWSDQDQNAYSRMNDLVSQYREDDRFAYSRMNDGTSRLDDLNEFNQQMAMERDKFAWQKEQARIAQAQAAADRAAAAARARSGGRSGGSKKKSSSSSSSKKASNSLSKAKSAYDNLKKPTNSPSPAPLMGPYRTPSINAQAYLHEINKSTGALKKALQPKSPLEQYFNRF